MHVSVIVTNHNYSRYLEQCLSSILNQTLRPREVIVVNDKCSSVESSSSREICARLRDSLHTPIVILDTEFGNVQLARDYGLKRASGEAILFVDADNWLDREFLNCCVHSLKYLPEKYAAVYPEIHRTDGKVIGGDPVQFWRRNMIDATCLVRRCALDASWVERGVPHEVYEDHHMWAQLMRAGWLFAYQSEAILHYRVHNQSMSHARLGRTWAEYYQPKITLFMPWSGRDCGMQALHAAGESSWGFDVRCVVSDGSSGHERRPLKQGWFSDFRHYKASPAKPLLSAPRLQVEHEVQLAMCRIYNKFATELDTELAWIVEDDVMVPRWALSRLLSLMDEDTMAVSGVYCSRYDSYGQPVQQYDKQSRVVAWTGGEGRALQMLTLGQAESMASGTKVAGTGFGCLLIRRDALQAIPFSVTDREPWYDPRFFRQAARFGSVKLATDVYCHHQIS